MLAGNHCFGCGPGNAQGLRIKSHWIGDRQARCVFQPEAHHCAGPSRYLNGGIIATLIDCHAICTAMAYAYRLAGRPVGEGEPLDYVTRALNVSYREPADIAREVTVDARVIETGERKIILDCSLTSGGALCAEGRVVAVKVSHDW